MWELENCVTLDQALKLYAIHRMGLDIEACKLEDMKSERRA